MSSMEHDALVIVTGDHREGGLPDLDAFRASVPEEFRPLIIGPIITSYNGCAMYAMLPDGSKDGWPPSDQADAIRERFKDLFRTRYDDGSTADQWVHVRFGDDADGDAVVESHCTCRCGCLQDAS